MSKKKIITIASIIVAAAILLTVAVIIAVVAFKDGNDVPDTPEYTGDWSECGVYYSTGGKPCELTLNKGGSFTLVYDTEAASGNYFLTDSTLTLDFSVDGVDNLIAKYESNVITMTYKGASMRMLKKVNYTVRFETDGAEEIPPITVMNGKTVTKPSDPTKENYLFVGWYSDSEYTKPFTFSSDVITSDITLYARWVEAREESEYTILFDIGYDGAEELEPRTTLGGRLFELGELERDNFEFGGWWISTEGDRTKLSYKWTEDTVFTRDTTLFAIWREKGDTKLEYPSLTANNNGVFWSAVSGARSYDVTLLDESGTVVFSRSVSTGRVDIPFSDYAPGIYRISVVANANTGTQDNSESHYVFVNKGLDKVGGLFVSGGSTLVFSGVENAEKYLITVVCGNEEHCHIDFDNGESKTFSFANCPMAKDGIKFVVKAVAEGFLTSVSDEFVFKRELASVDGLNWNEQTGIVGWNAVENAETYIVSLSCTNPLHNHSTFNKVTQTELDIKECSFDESGITISVYPVAEGYNSPEPTEIKIEKSHLKTPDGITVVGTVVGWTADTNASKYEISVNGTIYEANSNSFDLSNVLTFNEGDLYEIKLRAIGEANSLWSNPVICYYYALGGELEYKNGMLSWNQVIGADFYELQINDKEIKEIRGANYANIDFDRAGENRIKLRFACGEYRSDWVSLSVEAYPVIFDTLGGSAVAVQYKAVGDEVSLPNSTKIGYNFISWYNVPGGPSVNGKEIVGKVIKITGATTLYAHYRPEKYEITYNYGIGGTGLGVKDVVEYERDYTLEIPTAFDITVSFGGWFSAPYGRGTQYTDGSGKSLNPWTSAEGKEVYAFWIDETLVFSPVKVGGKDAYSVSAGPKISLVTEVTIPSYHNGLPVAMIEGNAFSGSKTLKKVNIPSSVEVISNLDPFSNCDSLTEINIYMVEGFSSSRYKSEDGVLFENASDGAVLLCMPDGREGGYIIPDWASVIGEGAFADSSIDSVMISDGVVKIASDAFKNCDNLLSVNFEVPKAEESKQLVIGKRAFAGCSALRSVVLPARLESIELSKYYIGAEGKFTVSPDYAFVDCLSLESIGVAEGSSSYSVVDGMIYSYDKRQILYCPPAKGGEISISQGTQSIAAGAFIDCVDITGIFIPNTVTYIGEYAFYGLDLTKVTFGGKGFSSVTVGNNSFAECKRLQEVVVEAGSQISVIGERAFSGCKGLLNFTISSSVTSIRDNAFENCINLGTVTFDGGKKPLEFGSSVFYNCTALTKVKIPANVSVIPGIFNGCSSLHDIEIDEANSYFASLGGIVFNKDMTEIVYYPQGRGGTYSIPETVTVIAPGVFYGNKSIEQLIIPNTVSYIGEGAFKNTKIGKILFAGDTFADELVIGRSAFEGAYFEGYDFALPSHTKHIEDYAFSGIFYKKIVLNEGLESIGNYAFYYPSNDNGEVLVIPSSVVSIGEYCFSGESDNYSYFVAHRFVNVRFTEENSKLIKISDYAFYKNTRLTSLILPDTVRIIGNYAFYECAGLTEISLSESLESIGAFAFAASANTYKVPISTLTLPKQLTSIGARAFENCQLLTEVIFLADANSPDLVVGSSYQRRYESDGVEMFAIERGGVFASCTRLLKVELSPNIVTLSDSCFQNSGDTGFEVIVPDNSRLATIGAYCFYKSRLVSFKIPASVRNLEPIEEFGTLYNRLGIGEYAFAASAGKLTEIVFLKDSNAYALTIGYGAFENQSNLTSIELPARLSQYKGANGEVIAPLANGALVFYGAKSLSTITAEEGCAYVVDGGVLYTADMKELVFCPVSYSGEIYVPASVTKIHDYALCGCTGVSAVTFIGKSGLTRIGNYAFFGCSAIKKLEIPGNVISLGEGALCHATSLESLTLPKILKNFDISVLDGCSALKNILVEGGNSAFSSDSGVLYNSDQTVLILYPAGRTDKQYTVKDSVLSIGKRAFYGNSAIEQVILPVGLREINASAFEKCSALESIVIPYSVEIIGENAFAFTFGLENLSFAKGGVTKLVIADGAFRESGVSYLELPSRISSIGQEAFVGSKLSSLSFENSDFSCLEEIGSYAFSNTLLVNVQLPSGVLTVGEGAFSETAKLDKVIFGEGLVEIGAEAFENSSLKEIYLPASLRVLGHSSFRGCKYLVSVSFAQGSQLGAIEEGTFSGCTSLERITVPTFVKEIGGEKENGAFYNCVKLQFVDFESNDNCITIGDYAFYGCEALSSFEIPMSVGTLGNYAFAKCASLLEIVINRATVQLGQGLFEDCTSLKEVELNTGATGLSEDMFKNCVSLTYLAIPASISEISDGCFIGSSIERFDTAKENKNLVSVSGILYNASKTAIVAFPPKLNIKTLVIPKEVAQIKSNNFKGCTSIKEVIFEEGGSIPLSIDSHAFEGCYEIRKVQLPQRLVSIGGYAFRDCSALTSVTIPKNVVSIGDYAFSGCSKLYEVYNESAIEDIGKKGSLNYINNNYYVNAKVNIYTPTEGASVLVREGEFIFTTVNGVKRLIGYEGDSSVIVLPEGSYALADYLFYKNCSITKVVIPATVKVSGSFLFSGCESLECIFVSGADIPTSWSDNWNNGKAVFGGYTGEDITYTFVTDGEQVNPITTSDKIKLPTAVYENHIFMGWYDNSEFSGNPYYGDYYSSLKTELYARFITEEEYIEEYLRGQSMEYAYSIESGETYEVEIKNKGAQNYFVLTVLDGEMWNISTPSGMGFHKIWIYDANGKELYSYFTGPSSDLSHDINHDYTFEEGGTYYIGVGYKYSTKESGTFEVTFTKI